MRSSVAHALYKVLESQTSGSMQPCIHAPNGTGYSLCNQTERAVLNYHNAACFYLCIENHFSSELLSAKQIVPMEIDFMSHLLSFSDMGKL